MLYERIYGKSLEKNWNQSFTSSQIVENPELLKTIKQEKDQMKPEKPLEKDIPKPVNLDYSEPAKTNTATVFVTTNKQIETRLPSGKRRITPMFLTPSPVSAT